MGKLNEKELNLYNACIDYECENIPCNTCRMFKKTGDDTGFCTITFIIHVLQSKEEQLTVKQWVDKVKQVRDEISEIRKKENNVAITVCLDVLDKLIEESE